MTMDLIAGGPGWLAVNYIARMQEIGADEMITVPSDLSECAVDHAMAMAAKNISDYVLTVCREDADEALSIAKNSYVPISVVVDQTYKLDEWTLKVSCGDESYCIWSPGA